MEEEMEFKACPIEFKAIGDKGEYEGHFAIFGNVDEGSDVSHEGMFLKTLQERGKRVKVFYMHDWTKLIGPTPTVLKEDSLGLFAAGRLTLDSFWGKETFALMKDGALNEGSFGYYPVKFDFEDRPNQRPIRHLREVILYEISPVPLGMNALTDIRATKRLLTHRPWQLLDVLESLSVDFKQGNITHPEDIVRAGRLIKAMQESLEVKFSGSPRNPFGTHSSYQFKGGPDGYKRAWRLHFSQINGGKTDADSTGPIRGTVRRTEMIGAVMKPKCELPSTDNIPARDGPRSPLPGTFPEKPSDYGLTAWKKPETDEDREGIKLSCPDLNIIKRAALAEIKRRAADRERDEATGKGEYQAGDATVPAVDGDPLYEELTKCLETPYVNLLHELKEGQILTAMSKEEFPGAANAVATALDALNEILATGETSKAIPHAAVLARRLRAAELALARIGEK